MPNLLHTFLHAGNVQARPVLGELFDYGSQSGLTGFFTPADESLQMQLVGYLDEIDVIGVLDVLIFNGGNEPTVKSLMTYAGETYQINSRKTDQSAFVIGLKKIST
jgi:hypothetical protein